PRPTARPNAGSRLPSVNASTSRCSTAASNAWQASTSSSGGTTCTDLTAPTKGSHPALALLSCRRREGYQCPGGLHLEKVIPSLRPEPLDDLPDILRRRRRHDHDAVAGVHHNEPVDSHQHHGAAPVGLDEAVVGVDEHCLAI